jgi:excisionase family DNA binding protein
LDEIELLTVEEAARRLSISRRSLYDLLERGELADIKVGRSRRVVAESIREYVRRHMPDDAELRRRRRAERAAERAAL